ncbi:MAG TPA: Fur family transcriptional regulator [Gemmatimonadales bacterium]|jgi:Fur family ferric uptake transcriptional regulator
MVDAGDASLQLVERFHRWLRERHLPITRQRDLVARALFAGGEHLSIDGVARRLRESGARVGTATIYRSIDILVESGLVRAHDFGEGFKRYEALLTPGPHGHLVCSRCGRIARFSTERFERLLPIVADEAGFQHQTHRVEIRGLCSVCREADAGALARAGRTP